MHSFGHSANNIFTECIQINTRQNNCTRQKTYLPSVGNKTLGKQQQDTRQKTATCDGRQSGCRPLELCRVSVSDTRQRESLPSVFIWHSANRFVCRVFYFGTREIKKFFPLSLKLFLLSTYNMWYSMLRFGIFLDPFDNFNLLSEIIGF